MKSTERIVAIMGGCDWYDASVEHLVIPKSMDLDEEHKLYKTWYHEVYCRNGRKHNGRVDYMTLSQWLVEKGARETSEDDIEELWED